MEVIELPKFEDARGTICIAELDTEIKFSISKILVKDHTFDDLSQYTNVTLIVVRGSLILEALGGEITINEDQCIFIPQNIEVSIKDSSKNALVLMLLHESESSDNNSSERFDTQVSVNDCTIAISSSEMLNYNTAMPNIQRIFYIKNVGKGSDRGGHAHRYSHQTLVAISGQLDVDLNDGAATKRVLLNNPNKTLHIRPYVWAKESNFSEDAICLVLASNKYDRSSYIDGLEDLISIKYEIHK